MQSKLSKLQKQTILYLFGCLNKYHKYEGRRERLTHDMAVKNNQTYGYDKSLGFDRFVEPSFCVTFHNSLHSLIKRGLIKPGYYSDSNPYRRPRMIWVELTPEGIETAEELLKD